MASSAAWISGFSDHAVWTYSSRGRWSKLDGTAGSRSQLRVERKPQQVVQFSGQIGELKFRSEHCLLAFEQARAALYRRHLQRTAIAYVFLALAQILSSIGGLLVGRLLLKTGDQDAEVKRMHLKRDLVLGLLQIVA